MSARKVVKALNDRIPFEELDHRGDCDVDKEEGGEREEDDKDKEEEEEEDEDEFLRVEHQQMHSLSNMVNGVSFGECECLDEDRERYTAEVDRFFCNLQDLPGDVVSVFAGPRLTYPTCPCPCMCPEFRGVTLLPLILSGRVRYRLNFGRHFETVSSCNLSTSDISPGCR